MGKILVVDDETSVLHAFRQMLTGVGHEVLVAESSEVAIQRIEHDQPDVVVSDICLPGLSGLDAFRKIRENNPRLPVIFMTGQGTVDSAIEAMKLGAFDYQLKPFDPESMIATIERALQGVRLMQRHVELNPQIVVSNRDAIIGSSPAMQEVYKAIGRVASTDATVLIRGESGTGKELVARAIYQHSRRSNESLLVVNCVAIPETLLESEMFGYERGAFTGANSRKLGKFEQAHRGTIFLDEIGDIPPNVQAKILRVLQGRTIERVGGDETISVDVRIIAATNRNLERALADGSFREDLYHRLNVVSLRLPSLRDRRGDLPELINYFVDRFANELKFERPILSSEAMDLLISHAWPGNVRELEHCVYRTLIFTGGYPIQADDVRQALAAMQEPPQPGALLTSIGDESLRDLVRCYLDANSGTNAHETLLETIDRLLIVEALARAKGNQTKASQLLGLTRPTLHGKIRRHEISDS
ncbi:MAG: sigma-54-dependent Fis family transcriptional regulator [Planctomycetales bacterium]|nr:sigma-54-dependent Fis family transcriptional regulator [Planctomycetales bacterium]